MLIFQHLLLGLVLGIIIALIARKPMAVLYTGFGSILPDLIDKPLGYIVLGESLNWGRIYAHTLVFTLIICIIGIFCIIKYKDVLLLCVGVGCLSHQITDSLKFNDWMYPFTEAVHMPPVNPVIFCIICIVITSVSYLLWKKYSNWCVVSGIIVVVGSLIWYLINGIPVALDRYITRMLPNLFPSYEIVCLIVSCIIIVSLIYIMKFKIKPTN